MSAIQRNNSHTMTTKEDKIIIFATRQSLLFLQNNEDWFMDGTFSTVPPKFLQLYTIHGIHHVRNVVGTYCLLRNKRRETYTEKISQLKHLTNNAIHHSIITFLPWHNCHIKSRISFSPTKSLLVYLSKTIYRHALHVYLSKSMLNNFGSQWPLLDF